MAQLKTLWRAIEDIPGATASLAEWRIRLGKDSSALEAMLCPMDRFAEAIPVPGDPYSLYRVVHHADDDIVGIHDDGGPSIAISKRDVMLYRLDFQRLIRKLTIAFGFECVMSGDEGDSSVHRIGCFRSIATFLFPVFLAIPLEPDDLLRLLEAVLAQHEEPFLLLAPTARRMRTACEQLLKRRESLFLCLEEAVEADGNGKWGVTEAARRRFDAFQARCSKWARARFTSEHDLDGTTHNSRVSPKSKPAKNRNKIEPRSWTQPELDAAILKYKVERASSYSGLVVRVQAERPGAIKAARKMFGRNAIALELGVKSRAMVSKSPEWQAIAEDLRLSRGKRRNATRPRKVGLEIAIEDQAVETSRPAIDFVVEQETVGLIQASLPQAEGEAVLEKLTRGEITDDEARWIVELAKEQKRDDGTRKIRGRP